MNSFQAAFRLSNPLAITLALALGLAPVSGCGADADLGDGLDDAFFVGGKADTAGIVDGSPQALGVLRLANEASFEVLDNPTEEGGVGLDLRAAENIVAYRVGDDQAEGSADDETFDSLAELDAIPYVGPVAFGALLAYAADNGFIDTPVDPSLVEGQWIVEDLGGELRFTNWSGTAPGSSHAVEVETLIKVEVTLDAQGRPRASGVCEVTDNGFIWWRKKFANLALELRGDSQDWVGDVVDSYPNYDCARSVGDRLCNFKLADQGNHISGKIEINLYANWEANCPSTIYGPRQEVSYSGWNVGSRADD